MTATTAPLSCTCRASEVAAPVDVVNHEGMCALMAHLEGLISEDILNPSDMTDPGQPAYVLVGTSFMCIPGMDGEVKMVP